MDNIITEATDCETAESIICENVAPDEAPADYAAHENVSETEIDEYVSYQGLENREPEEDSEIECSEPDNGGAVAEDEGGKTPTLAADFPELLGEFPELSARLSESLVNTERYSKLRALGLTPREAYLATSRTKVKSNRSHLTSSVPAGAKSPSGGMTKREMENAKYLFGDLSEREIVDLYNKVTR